MKYKTTLYKKKDKNLAKTANDAKKTGKILRKV